MNPESVLELLREEMQNEETFLRVNAMHRVPTVAVVLGPDNVKNQLLPYLNNLLREEEDEVLFAIAQELAGLIRFLRGSYSLLIPPLEQLATMEETVVRDEAVRSLKALAEEMPDSDIVSAFAPMVIRLAEQEKFSGKVAASCLTPAAYPRAGNFKEKLRAKFIELSHDETPMIRRAVALNMAEISQVVEKEVLLSQLMSEFKQLSVDEQDSIRNLCIDALISISKLLTREENRLYTLPLALTAGEDKSWKVRIHFAEKFPELAEAFGREMTENSLVQTFAQLLKDMEADVRAVCLKSLRATMKNLSNDKVETLIYPHLSFIAQDTNANAHVRMHLADIIGEMAAVMGGPFTMNNLVPLLKDMLKDDNAEVKMHVTNTLEKFASVLGSEVTTSRLCASVLSLARDCANWRVREAVITQTAELGRILGAEVFVRALQPTFFLFLKDISHAVRKTGTKHLKGLAAVMRSDWPQTHLLPALRETYSACGYTQRITILHCLTQVDLSMSEVVGLLSEAARSQVPNIRFNVCKVAQALLKKQNSPEIRTIVQSLANDPDNDVTFYAQMALKAAN